MKSPIFLCLIAAAICMLTADAVGAVFDIKRTSASALSFHGYINDASKDALLLAFDDRVTTLRVNSEGGELWAGVVIGKYVHDHHITVEVEERCASACANYIFLGAETKRLLPGAVLGFHGNMLPDLPAEKLAALRALGEPQTIHAKTFEDVVQLNWRLELAFLDRIAMSTSFFNHVNDVVYQRFKALGRERTDVVGELTITTAAEVRHFQLEQMQLVAGIMEEMQKNKVDFKMDMKVTAGSGYDDILYFPNRGTLQRFGVTGILDYPYPASEADLKNTALLKKSPSLNVIADF